MSRREFFSWLLSQTIENTVITIVLGCLYIATSHPATVQDQNGTLLGIAIGIAIGTFIGSGVLLIVRLARQRRAA